MPDAIIVNDPFAKPSLEKEVVTIAYGAWDMALQLPNLGNAFTLSAIQSPANSTLASSAHRENSRKEEVKDGVIHSLRPGVYLLQRKHCAPKQNWTADSQWNTIRLGEYAAPAPRATSYRVMHTPATTVEANKPLNSTDNRSGISRLRHHLHRQDLFLERSQSVRQDAAHKRLYISGNDTRRRDKRRLFQV